MDTMLQDIRSGIRSLLRQPTFTIVAVLTLALGIAANTSVYSVIQALIPTPPSIVEPERVVAIWETPLDKRVEGYLSYLDLQDWRNRNQSCACSVFFVSLWFSFTAIPFATETQRALRKHREE